MRESYLLFSAMMCKTKLCYYRDVRYTVMILVIICQLVCVTDPWAHMSFVHSILSLKLGVKNWYQSTVDCRTQAQQKLVVLRFRSCYKNPCSMNLDIFFSTISLSFLFISTLVVILKSLFSSALFDLICFQNYSSSPSCVI